jgi:dienelactone hydrolase
MSGPALPGWDQYEHTAAGLTRTVYRKGTGTAVVVIHEIPGITPKVQAFAEQVVARGHTVFMPSLVGTPGKEPGVGYVAQSFFKVCVAKEFTNWALDSTSPVIDYLRDLARAAHAECGGPGVGAVGMCFSGGFALGMMLDDTTVAPVLSQPSMPFVLARSRAADINLSPADLERVKARAASGCEVLGLRFSGDKMVPDARWATLERTLGDRFIAVTLDSSPGNPHGHKARAHSVLTEDLDDRPGTPTRAALDQVLDFFDAKLATSSE